MAEVHLVAERRAVARRAVACPVAARRAAVAEVLQVAVGRVDRVPVAADQPDVRHHDQARQVSVVTVEDQVHHVQAAAIELRSVDRVSASLRPAPGALVPIPPGLPRVSSVAPLAAAE